LMPETLFSGTRDFKRDQWFISDLFCC